MHEVKALEKSFRLVCWRPKVENSRMRYGHKRVQTWFEDQNTGREASSTVPHSSFESTGRLTREWCSGETAKRTMRFTSSGSHSPHFGRAKRVFRFSNCHKTRGNSQLSAVSISIESSSRELSPHQRTSQSYALGRS